MNINLRLAFLLLISLLSANLQAQTWQWAEKGAGAHNEFAGDIDIDANGNSYVTGKFFNAITFGAITLNSPGTWSVYIAKYDVNGVVQWAKIAATAGNIKANGICVDVYGYISITGIYADSASFGDVSPTTLYAVAGYDIFLARYSSTGDLSWAHTAGDIGYDYSSAVSTDAHGNLFITGEFHISSYTGSAAKVFVAKYDSSGATSWFNLAEQYGNFHQGNDIKTSAGGTSYVTGQFFDSLHFDPATDLAAGNIEANIFVLKISDSGTVIWMRAGGGPGGYTSGNAIDIDTAGDAFITGFYRGTINLGALTLTGPVGISYDVYVARCSVNGDFEWVNKASGPWDLDNATCICSDKMGSCYVAGNFQDSLKLGNYTVYSPGQSNIFLGKLDSAGNFTWADECGSPAFDDIAGTRANSLGLFLTGDFKGTGLFGPSLTLTGDSSDIFTSRIYDGSPEGLKSVGMAAGISVFPNPVSEALYLSGTNGTVAYEIYDISGRVLLQGNAGANSMISVSGLEPGMYFVHLSGTGSEGPCQALKFIKS